MLILLTTNNEFLKLPLWKLTETNGITFTEDFSRRGSVPS